MHTAISGLAFASNRRPGEKAPVPPPPSHPLTHHDILGLIEPFARRGRHLDLAQSDRIRRRLAFRPIEHGDALAALPGLREDLKLEQCASDIWRLTRALSLPSGLKATLQADGPDPGALLAGIERISPSRQFRSHADVVIALSYVLTDDGAGPARMMLAHAEARVEGVTLHLTDAQISGYPADIDLTPQAGAAFEFPDDLLAVLGSGWGLLRRHRAGWSGQVNVSGKTRDRSHRMESMFERMVAHLAETLAGPPSRFHETRLRARWMVALRRATPLLLYLALLAGVGGLSMVKIPEGSVVRNLIWFMPTVLMFGAFTRKNLPRLEFPSLPRRPSPSAWRPPKLRPRDREQPAC